jgi:hypothetical protein
VSDGDHDDSILLDAAIEDVRESRQEEPPQAVFSVEPHSGNPDS